jgi:ribonuclease J
VGNSVFYNPSQFVYFVRCPNEKLVNKLRNHGIINIIYSQWEGYLLEEHKNYCTEIINTLRKDSGISFQTIHTTGHATVPDLINFAKAINSNKIVPIHTAFPEVFKEEFEKEGFKNINLWDDGKEYQL